VHPDSFFDLYISIYLLHSLQIFILFQGLLTWLLFPDLAPICPQPLGVWPSPGSSGIAVYPRQISDGSCFQIRTFAEFGKRYIGRDVRQNYRTALRVQKHSRQAGLHLARAATGAAESGDLVMQIVVPFEWLRLRQPTVLWLAPVQRARYT